MELRGKMIPCRSREAVVTVLSYRNGIMDGYLQHPRLEHLVKTGFCHIVSDMVYRHTSDCLDETQDRTQMVLLLNSLIDLEDCPNRSLPLVSGEQERDRKHSVFRIQVLFREHYSWQGRLIWQNENQEIVFRSVIELIQLFDEILGE